MSRPSDVEPPLWDQLASWLPAYGWRVVYTTRWVALLQLAYAGLLMVDIVSPEVYQVRLTAAGRLYRARMAVLNEAVRESTDAPPF